MKPEIIKTNSYIAAFDDLVRRVKARKVSPDRRTVVIVPDKYTLHAERRLFLGGGAFDVEAVTFSRLVTKTGYRPKNYISRFGAIMLIKKIVGDGENLRCFRRSARFNGFAGKMYDTIAQLRASGVTPDDLRRSVSDSDSRAFRDKISDIADIAERFYGELEGRYTDPTDLLAALPEALKTSGYLDGATVYILNFDRFTASHRAAIAAIAERADRTYIYDVEPAEEVTPSAKRKIEIYSAPSLEGQLRAAAARIRCLMADGGFSLNDFCIVSPDCDYGTAKRVMEEYGLPFELDCKYPLSLHPCVRYLYAVLEAADGRLMRTKLIALARNMLTGIDREQSSLFENYVCRRRIDYKGFAEVFGGETDPSFIEEEKVAEEVRKRLLGIVLPVSDRLSARMRATDFTALIRDILSGAADKERFSSEDFSAVAPYNTLSFYSALDDTIALMNEVMGGGEFDCDMLVATLKEGVRARELAFLPRKRDCVMIGQPSLFRGQKFKKVFVIGFNEGVLPPVTKDVGIITDEEIDRLGRGGAVIEPRTSEVNMRGESELRHLLSGCDDLFLSYTATGDGAAASGMLTVIRSENIGTLTETSASEETRNVLYKYTDCPETAAMLACSLPAAKRLFLSGLRCAYLPDFMSGLSFALKSGANELQRDDADEPFRLESGELFFRTHTAYISQIQTFFLCPYRHFLQYGLGLKERADGSVTPRDVGVILHKVAERYVKDDVYEGTDAAAAELFERVMAEDFKSFADITGDARRRLKDEAMRLCRTIKRQYECSLYRPYGTEERFGKTAPRLKTAPVRLKSGGSADIVGVMDRIDVCGDRARVIDYKTGFVGTGKKGVGLDKLRRGVKIQLPFYAAVLKDNGFEIGGMFYFPVSNNWNAAGDHCRMLGVFDGDTANVIDMDRTIAGGGKSELFNAALAVKKDGSVGLKRNSLAFDRKGLNALCDYAKAVFDSGVADIDDGVIEASPYTDKNSSACDFCPYTSVCCRLDKKPRS